MIRINLRDNKIFALYLFTHLSTLRVKKSLSKRFYVSEKKRIVRLFCNKKCPLMHLK